MPASVSTLVHALDWPELLERTLQAHRSRYKRIVEHCGGKVDIHSEQNLGNQIQLTFLLSN